MTAPDFLRETALIAAGCPTVCGVDEVGRGPLAGPVVAAAVILNPACIPKGLNDSKRLSARTRECLFDSLMAVATVSVARASVAEIDRLNILRASHLAMVRAVQGLAVQARHAIIDGNLLPDGLPCPATAVISGDALCLSVAAASIVAKVTRDRDMVALAQQHPGYGWEKNMGYPTFDHRAALVRLGVTPHHRRSFAPVHKLLYQENSVTR